MKTSLFFLSIVLTACAGSDQRTVEKAAITLLADSYYTRYLDQFPEEAYWYGVETDKHDKIESKKMEDIGKWQSYEDSLYQLFNTLDGCCAIKPGRPDHLLDIEGSTGILDRYAKI